MQKIVLATVTAWKDSSTQRYLKGIVDTINAIHKVRGGGQRPGEEEKGGLQGSSFRV